MIIYPENRVKGKGFRVKKNIVIPAQAGIQ